MMRYWYDRVVKGKREAEVYKKSKDNSVPTNGAGPSDH